MTRSSLLEIRSALEAVELDASLLREESFLARVAALDLLEFHIIDRLHGLCNGGLAGGVCEQLLCRAESLRVQLEAVDERLWESLRQAIRAGRYTHAGLRQKIAHYAGPLPDGGSEDSVAYDALDVFVNGLLNLGPPPEETRAREPEMVFYQPTPPRLILEMIDRARILPRDTFYDLGSGLGQVVILVALLTGARATGIEFEPAFCAHARQCAHSLNLAGVAFHNLDARQADYSEGTVFFLYTPFQGAILQHVLAKLASEARARAIRVCTYGPCTAEVAQQTWLRPIHGDPHGDHRLTVFVSG